MVSATSLRSKQQGGRDEVGEIEAIFSTKPSISTSSPSAKRASTDKVSKVDLESGNKKQNGKGKEKEKQRIAKKVDGNGIASGRVETQHPEGNKRKRQPPSNPSNPDTVKADGTSNQDATRWMKKPKPRTTVQVFTDTSSSSLLPLATQPVPKPKSTPLSRSTDMDLDQFTDSRGTTRKRTQDGLRIFSAQELKLGQGNADTPLCPFDCNCCMFHPPPPQPSPSFFSGFFRPPHELLTLQW